MANYDDQLGIPSTSTTKGAEKPLFFNMLLIFSLGGNSLAFLGGILFYGMSGMYTKMFRLPSIAGRSVMNDELEIAERMFRMFGWWSVALLIGSLICLIGLFLMWKSKLSGFTMYVIGQLVPIGCYIFFILMFTSGVPIKPFVVILIMFSLFPLAFILMFGLHLKYLK